MPLVVITSAVLVVTGAVNAVSGPLGYLDGGNVGVLILGGSPLFLAVAQTVCGVAWVLFGILLLTRRRFPWGAALVSAGVFATFETYFVVRGAVIHYVGLFLALVVMALLHQAGVRRYCKIGPPAH